MPFPPSPVRGSKNFLGNRGSSFLRFMHTHQESSVISQRQKYRSNYFKKKHRTSKCTSPKVKTKVYKLFSVMDRLKYVLNDMTLYLHPRLSLYLNDLNYYV